MMKEMSVDSYRLEQVTKETVISKNQYKEISDLIFDTDPYIYPALFGSNEAGRKNAQIILPVLFETEKDAMFSKENLFLLFSGVSVVGVLLWRKGAMTWTAEGLIDVAEMLDVELNKDNVMKVSHEYVDKRYSDLDLSRESIISLVNVCVSKDVRGRGLGSRLLGYFISLHRNEPMTLCVLADNPRAICLYKNNGFQIVNSYDGFSLDNEKPRAYEMERR